MYWILPIGLFPQYKFYHREICIGKTKISFFSPRRIIIINNICYELYLHNNNYISILKNNVQIALIKKSEMTMAEENKYIISFDENLEKDVGLLTIFVAFIDVIFYPNRYKLNYVKYEKTIGIDKLYNRTLWKPDDK